MTVTCKCGKTYRDDWSGRLHYKQVQGHPPTRDREAASADAWRAAVARAGRRRRDAVRAR